MESLVDLSQVYKNKRVFLTGHTGFKGSWLLAWLHKMGAIVKGYALEPQTPEDLFYKIEGETLCQSVIADIRDNEKIKHEILDFQPDFIFHLAAQPLVRLSYELPVYTFETNVIGTANLLDAVRFLEKKCTIICITTDKVYENKEWQYPYREIDRLGGYDPYSASKAASEIVISSYRNSFFNPTKYNQHHKALAVARAGNVIGGGDWSKDRIIPDIVTSLMKKESVIVRNPKAVRPWQHVLEPLSGYLLLGSKLDNDPIRYADAYNFGPHLEDTLSVKELVELAIQKYGYGEYEMPILHDQPHEAGLLKLDINKAINDLGWRPRWDAKRAIHETIGWYLNETDIYQQIQQYSK